MDIAEINASFELNKRKLAFIQMLCDSVKTVTLNEKVMKV